MLLSGGNTVLEIEKKAEQTSQNNEKEKKKKKKKEETENICWRKRRKMVLRIS